MDRVDNRTFYLVKKIKNEIRPLLTDSKHPDQYWISEIIGQIKDISDKRKTPVFFIASDIETQNPVTQSQAYKGSFYIYDNDQPLLISPNFIKNFLLWSARQIGVEEKKATNNGFRKKLVRWAMKQLCEEV